MTQRLPLAVVGMFGATLALAAVAAERTVPEPLKGWEDWAVWDDVDRFCPIPYNTAARPKEALRVWPSALTLSAGTNGAQFSLEVQVYAETWVELPGGGEEWPVHVKSGGQALAVVERGGAPSVRLAPGAHRLSGELAWKEMPEKLLLPASIGLLDLTLNGEKVEAPSWDASGQVWLKRARAEEADKDFLSVQIHRLVEDGIPMWLRTEIEVSVAGKGREETIGAILPEGWTLSSVNSPIPVAVDELGRMKAQVRAGKWTVSVNAFRLSHAAEVKFAEGLASPVEKELVAFQTRPELRIAEIAGLTAVDASQTAFPAKWRGFPVFVWERGAGFRVEEKMRGMGFQKPGTLGVERHLWLDADGKAFTARETLLGQKQQIWRLDAAAGRSLGSVKVDGQGQLITRSPVSGAEGVEVRSREFSMEAVSRFARGERLRAVGWEADVDSLGITMDLPPGWRLLALIGAERVEGDWLTSWTLLDLFLVLVFALAMFKLWGVGAGAATLVAFGLSYHEPQAPRFAWLVLLAAVALLRVVPGGVFRNLIVAWRWIAGGVLVVMLVPFVTRQVQEALYPQLERADIGAVAAGGGRMLSAGPNAAPAPLLMRAAEPEQADQMRAREDEGLQVRKSQVSAEAGKADKKAIREELRTVTDFSKAWSEGVSGPRGKEAQGGRAGNLMQAADARIQTGPGVPEWHWNTVRCSWSGPVARDASIHPILIPPYAQRTMALLRALLVVWLAAFLLGVRRVWFPAALKAACVPLVLAAVLGAAPSAAAAELPGKEMLGQLRERLLKVDEAFPHAAQIPSVALNVGDTRLVMDAEIHMAAEAAVPLPGRLPGWSPVSVSVGGKPAPAVRRQDGYLWVVLPAGVHKVRAEGLLPGAAEWEWTFHLKPRRVEIEAPEWTVTGVKPTGEPEGQIFFVRKQGKSAAEAAYDRRDFAAVVVVERNIELGLDWGVRTVVRRLSERGKAVSLRVPLLPGEKVLTPGMTVENGRLAAQLGAHEEEMVWESELEKSGSLALEAEAGAAWAEQWRLQTSPVWNVAMEGLAPVFQEDARDLAPVWRPWPGEKALLKLSRPEAAPGATMTVRRAEHTMRIGKSQRNCSLNLVVQSSLGNDLQIDLDEAARITELRIGGNQVPVRREGGKVIVPIRPGEQEVALEWKQALPLGVVSEGGLVRLGVEAANIETRIELPDDRWVLWTAGPAIGPAVRFWVVLVVALITAWVVGGLGLSPIPRRDWMLLAVGLTQVPAAAAILVVVWLFALAWRGRGETAPRLSAWAFGLVQIGLVVLTIIVLPVLIGVVSQGLLGMPEMFVKGNGSYRGSLAWFEARVAGTLPQPRAVSVSIWFYRILMLFWALWLAAALLRWLKWGWEQFSRGGLWKARSRSAAPVPPPLAKA